VSVLITFWKLQVKANFVFCQFISFLGFRTKSAKKVCLRFAIFNCSKKLQNIFEIGFKKCEVIVQKLLSEKKNFKKHNLQTCFCFLYINLATVQIWGQSNKSPLSCNSLKCLLQAKKCIRENSAKEKSLASQTNSAHKRLQQCSQITEPISAWKIYYHWLTVKFTHESPKHPCVLQYAQARFFLKLVWQNREDEKGYKR